MALKSNAGESGSTELNFLGNGTRIEGTIEAQSSVRLDGFLKGKLICKNTLTVGTNGSIEGEVEAKNAIIGGKIVGKIRVAEKLVLENNSRLVGDLKANKLIIDEGAVFEGTSKMGAKESVPPIQAPEKVEKKPGEL